MEEAARVLDECDIDLEALELLVKRRRLRIEEFEDESDSQDFEPSALEESTGLITDFVKQHDGWKNLTFSTLMFCKESGSKSITPIEWRPNPLERLLFADRSLPDFSTLPLVDIIGPWQELEEGVLYGKATYKLTVSCKQHNIEDKSTYNGKKQGVLLETGSDDRLTVYRPFLIKNKQCFIYSKRWSFNLPLPDASTLYKHHGKVEYNYDETPFMFKGEEWLVTRMDTNICLWDDGVIVP